MRLTRQLFVLLFVIITALFIFFANENFKAKYNNIANAVGIELEEEIARIAKDISNDVFLNRTENFTETLNIIIDTNKYDNLQLENVLGNIIFYKDLANVEKKIDLPLVMYFFRPDSDYQIRKPVVFTGDTIAYLQANVSNKYLKHLFWHDNSNKIWLAKILSLYIIFLLGAAFILNFLFKPFNKILIHVRKIANREFYIEEEPESTQKDIQEIAECLNNTSIKIKKLFNEGNELSELIRNNSYRDSLTNLANRQYFYLNLEHLLRGFEVGVGGLLIVLEVPHNIIDPDILKKIAYQLKKIGKIRERILLTSYLGGNSFAFIVKDILEKDIDKYSEDLLKELTMIFEKENLSRNIYFGLTEYKQGSFPQGILEEALSALEIAKKNKTNNWERFKKIMETSPIAKIDWDPYFKEVLDENKIVLHYQPVYFYEADGTILFHNEVLMRILGKEKELMFSGMFLPLIYAHQLGVSFDKLVIENVLDRIEDSIDGWQRYGINLSQQSLESKSFLQWLDHKFANFGDSVRRINFEFHENFVRNNVDLVKTFIEQVSKYHIQVGIDHFGQGFSDFSYLENLKIDYIKIDGIYSKLINKNTKNQAIIRTFVDVAHTLDILIFATCVEILEEKETLNKLNIDGVQGFFIGQPI